MSLTWLEDPPPPPQLGFDLGEADGRVPAVPVLSSTDVDAALQEAFGKQLVSVKPNESLAEAQTWLNNELATWRKTTAEVKIDLN